MSPLGFPDEQRTQVRDTVGTNQLRADAERHQHLALPPEGAERVLVIVAVLDPAQKTEHNPAVFVPDPTHEWDPYAG